MNFCVNCMPVLKIVGAYAVVFIINSIFGIYHNVVIGAEKFSLKRVLVTLCEMLIIAVSAIGITVAFEFIESGLTELGFNVEESLTNIISVFTFIVLFVEAFITKAKEVFEKIKAMTGAKITIEEAKEKELKYRKPKIEASGLSAEGMSAEKFINEVG